MRMLSEGKVLRRTRVRQQNVDARLHALWKQFDAGELSARKLLLCPVAVICIARMCKTTSAKTMPFNSQLFSVEVNYLGSFTATSVARSKMCGGHAWRARGA